MAQSRSVVRRVRPLRRGFSLTELMFAVGIIALLLSLILVAFARATAAGRGAEVSNALRQMGVAWTAYANDHDGALLPGYISPATQQDLGIRVTGPGNQQLAGADAASYVWRLVPYMERWDILTTGYATNLVNVFENEIEQDGIYGPASATPGSGALGLASAPVFGINSMFLGGDDTHFVAGDDAGESFANLSPYRNRFSTQAVTQMSQVTNTARTIVFAPTVRWDRNTWANAASTPYRTGYGLGAPVVMPPQLPETHPDGFPATAAARYWALPAASTDARAAITTPPPFGTWSGDIGVPGRRDADEERLPHVRVDGSVGTEDIGTVGIDRAYWDPRATGIGLAAENDRPG